MIDWEDLVLQTAERYGGTIPHPDTAQAIANVYAKAPTAVQKAIDRVALEYEQGGIRSPWGILKSRVQQIQVSEKTTHRANDREKAIARAEQWMKTAGIHYDRQSEVIDELYGERGPLHQHPDTQARIIDLWYELRPTGEKLESEHEAFMARYAEQRANIDHTPAPKTRSTEELKALALAKSLPVTHTIEETP